MQWAAFGKFYTNSHVWEVTASRRFVWAKVSGSWSRRSSGPLSSSLGRPFNNKGWHLNSSWLLHKCKISSCDPECKDETVILVFFICLWTFPLIFLFVLWLSVVVFLLCCCSLMRSTLFRLGIWQCTCKGTRTWNALPWCMWWQWQRMD